MIDFNLEGDEVINKFFNIAVHSNKSEKLSYNNVFDANASSPTKQQNIGNLHNSINSIEPNKINNIRNDSPEPNHPNNTLNFSQNSIKSPKSLTKSYLNSNKLKSCERLDNKNYNVSDFDNLYLTSQNDMVVSSYNEFKNRLDKNITPLVELSNNHKINKFNEDDFNVYYFNYNKDYNTNFNNELNNKNNNKLSNSQESNNHVRNSVRCIKLYSSNSTKTNASNNCINFNDSLCDGKTSLKEQANKKNEGRNNNKLE